MIGLCTQKSEVRSSIILSGDPKQLEPVTISENAIKLGFKTSLMGRLFEQPAYKRTVNGYEWV